MAKYRLLNRIKAVEDNSGTPNLKTVNGQSLLGQGNVTISGEGARALLSQYNDLSDAITQIGSTITVLEIDSDVTITSAITIPETLQLNFSGKTITKGSGGSLVFEGVGVAGTPLMQLFVGFQSGQIRWTGSYPDRFFIEWFGGVADGSTDNLAAWNALQESLEGPSSSFNGTPIFRGATVQFLGGDYRFSDTINVRRSMQILGVGSSWGWLPSTRLLIDDGHIGIDVFLTNFESSIFKKNGAGTIISGLSVWNSSVRGGMNTFISPTTGTVSTTNGSLTVTATGSTAFDTEWADGQSIIIGDAAYMIDKSTPLTTTTLVVKKPFGYGTLNAGTKTLTIDTFPYLSSSFAGASVTINGVSYTINTVSAEKTSFTVVEDVPANVTWARWELQGLRNQTDVGFRPNIYHGIDLRSTAIVEKVMVVGFSGNGININTARTPVEPGVVEYNANNFRLENIGCYYNAHGIYLKGINTNNGVIRQQEATSNFGYGMYDGSFLGNYHEAGHYAANNFGSIYSKDVNPGNLFVRPYAETGQPSVQLGENSMIIGGTIDKGVDISSPMGGWMRASNVGASSLTVDCIRSESIANGFYSADPNGRVVSGWLGQTRGDAALAFGYSDSASWPDASYKLRTDQGATGWWSWQYAGSANILSFSDSTASAGGGHVAFPAGFRFGLTDPHITKMVPGTATLVNGTVTVSIGSVEEGSIILLTGQDGNANGTLWVSARVANTSFTITSSDNTDSGVVGYLIINP